MSKDRDKFEGESGVYPPSMFDVSTPEGERNFAGLMQFQYGLSDEEAALWGARAAKEKVWEDRTDLLVEITAPEHRFYRRLGQLMGAEHKLFVGSEELYRAGVRRSEEAVMKFGLALNINSIMVTIPGGSYRTIEKASISPEDRIEVQNRAGRRGLLLRWKPSGKRLPSGFYVANFRGREVRTPDCLMLQDPRWIFRRTVIS